MRQPTKSFKLNVPEDLLEKLKDIAARENRSVTAQINRMLSQQVEAHDAAA